MATAVMQQKDKRPASLEPPRIDVASAAAELHGREAAEREQWKRDAAALYAAIVSREARGTATSADVRDLAGMAADSGLPVTIEGFRADVERYRTLQARQAIADDFEPAVAAATAFGMTHAEKRQSLEEQLKQLEREHDAVAARVSRANNVRGELISARRQWPHLFGPDGRLLGG